MIVSSTQLCELLSAQLPILTEIFIFSCNQCFLLIVLAFNPSEAAPRGKPCPNLTTHSKIGQVTNLSLGVCVSSFCFLELRAGLSAQSQFMPFCLLHSHSSCDWCGDPSSRILVLHPQELPRFFSVCIDPNPEVLCPYSALAAYKSSCTRSLFHWSSIKLLKNNSTEP